jgi:hypothetical protein
MPNGSAHCLSCGQTHLVWWTSATGDAAVAVDICLMQIEPNIPHIGQRYRHHRNNITTAVTTTAAGAAAVLATTVGMNNRITVWLYTVDLVVLEYTISNLYFTPGTSEKKHKHTK